MFHPELRLLKCLVAIAEEGSITRAAKRLNLTQPTVSGQLKDLETQLGFSLFTRSTRSVTPTRELGKVLPLAQQVTSAAEHLQTVVEAMQQKRATHFRLGAAMYSLDFPERVKLTDAFCDQFPAITFQIDNRLQHSQIRDLMAGHLDIAFLLGVPVKHLDPEPEAGVIANEVQYPDTFDRIVLASRQVGLLIPEGSPLAHGESPIEPGQLREQKIAMMSKEHGSAFIDPLAAFLRAAGAELFVPPEGNALAVQRYAARHNICGIGIGWFPPLPGQAFRHVKGLEQSVEFSLVLGTSPTAAAIRFFDFAKVRVTAQQPATT
ncbi:MAG: LysR family transcriptional regulator [Novosphingobium sp.]|nr:LysR family transcriptional regulator [Novosphingobium sp.]